MKNRLPHLLLAASVVLLLGSAPAVQAKGKVKAVPIEHHDTVISSISPTSITIMQDKTSKTYTINQFTEITFRGQKTTADALSSGMAVSVTMGTDPLVASRITASDPVIHNDPPKRGGR